MARVDARHVNLPNSPWQNWMGAIIQDLRPPGADKKRLPPASFPGNVSCMSAVEIAVKKVKNLSARQARELLGWLDERQANGKPSIRPRHRSRQSALARRKRNFKEWHDSVRGNTDWEPPRMPDDLVKAIPAVNFVLDTNAVSELRKPRPNSYFGQEMARLPPPHPISPNKRSKNGGMARARRRLAGALWQGGKIFITLNLCISEAAKQKCRERTCTTCDKHTNPN